MKKKVKGHSLEKDVTTNIVTSTDKNALARRRMIKKQAKAKDQIIEDQNKRISDLEKKLEILLSKFES